MIRPWLFSGRTLAALLSDGNTSAWYSIESGLTSASFPEVASAWSNKLGAVPSLTAAGAAQPYAAVYAGTPYVRGWAATGVSATTVSITGNFTITVDLAADDYTPGSNINVVTQSTGNFGFQFQLVTNGKLRLRIGDSAAFTNFDSTVATGLTDGSRHTLRVVYVDGGSGSAMFFVDGVQLGTTVATNKTLAYSSVAFFAMNGNFSGKFYSAQVTNGAGTTYFDSTPVNPVEGAGTYTGADGKTYTIGSGASASSYLVVNSSHLLFDGTAMEMRTGASARNQPRTVYAVARQVTWTGNDYLFDDDSLGVSPTMGLLQHTATPKLAINAGSVVADNANAALSAWVILTVVFNGASSSLQVGQTAAVSANAGANNGTGITLGSDGLAVIATFGNWRCKAFIDRSVADTAGMQTSIQQALAQQFAVSL